MVDVCLRGLFPIAAMPARATLTVASLLLIACSGGGSITLPTINPPRLALPGTYMLQSVDGRSLPAVVVQTVDNSLEIMSGELTVTSDDDFQQGNLGTTRWGDFTLRSSVRQTAVGSGETHVVDESLQYRWSDDRTITVTVAGPWSTIVGKGTVSATKNLVGAGATIVYVPNVGHSYVYRK